MAPKSMQEFGALRNVKSLKSVIRIAFFKGSHFEINVPSDSETALSERKVSWTSKTHIVYERNVRRTRLDLGNRTQYGVLACLP